MMTYGLISGNWIYSPATGFSIAGASNGCSLKELGFFISLYRFDNQLGDLVFIEKSKEEPK